MNGPHYNATNSAIPPGDPPRGGVRPSDRAVRRILRAVVRALSPPSHSGPLSPGPRANAALAEILRNFQGELQSRPAAVVAELIAELSAPPKTKGGARV